MTKYLTISFFVALLLGYALAFVFPQGGNYVASKLGA